MCVFRSTLCYMRILSFTRFFKHTAIILNTTVGSSFFHLRSLFEIKSFLSKSSLEVAIHAFVTSRLGYCNSLSFGLKILKSLGYAAARFLKRCKKFDHVTPSWDHCIGCQFTIELRLKYCYLSTIKLLPICLIYSITTGEGTKIGGQMSPPYP